VPVSYVPGETLTVSLRAVPSAAALAYAVQDTFPAGWAVELVGQGGALDVTTGQVKWGPFLDALPRSLTYRVTPPPTACGPAGFSGAGSFDGASVAASAAQPMREACRLQAASLAQGGSGLSLRGRAGAPWIVEGSADLVNWQPLTTGVLPPEGQALLPIGRDPAQAVQFYRARLIE
jgi:hypothetical protein